MSNVEGSAVRNVFSKRARVAAVVLVVTAMLGTGLTLAFNASTVDAAPVADVVDGTVCYSFDEGTGDATEDQQYLHEVTLTAGNPPTAVKTPNPPLSEDAGNIESIALRNDASELYAYNPTGTPADTMYVVNGATGVQSTPTDFALSSLGDIDAMFFQNDTDGNPANDILWTVTDIDTSGAAVPDPEDQDELRGYNTAGTLVAGPIAIDFDGPGVDNANATIEGATWVPDGAGGGEFFISYTDTGASTDSFLASLGTNVTPASVPSVLGTTQIDVEGLGTDGGDQLFLTTGEDGLDADNFYQVDPTNPPASTFLLDMAANPPAGGGGDSDFESVDCAYADITLTKSATSAPVRLPNGNTSVSYTFVIENTGLLQLGSVTLTDPMTEFVNAGTIVSGPVPDDINGDCSTDVFAGTQTLNIGETCTAIWIYEVDVPPATYNNTASVTGTPPNGIANPVNDDGNAQVVVPAAPQPSLQIVKSVRATAGECPATVAAAIAAGDDGLGARLPAATGTDVVYCINVINNGPGTADNVAVNDSFDGVTNIGTLTNGQENAYNYTHTVGTNPETNTATVSGDDQDGNAVTPDSDTAGTSDPVVDASISDFVFEDTNGDGVQTAGEPGIPGVVVNLLDSGGNQIATDTTDANGLYSFTGLTPGDYIVEFEAPTGRTFATPDQGGDDALDSDADVTTGRTPTITLGANEDNDTVDAGLLPITTSSISDFVFQDDDSDGVQDAGELGVPGVTVNLWSNNNGAPGSIIGTDTTDLNGLYSFDNLSAGDYFVQFVAPTGRTFSPQDQGGDDAADSDPDTTTGITALINLGVNEQNDTIDAGLLPIPPASISDFVFEDTDSDGIQDAGEPGIPGVVVNLWSNNNGAPGSVIGTDTTDANGLYSFDNLSAGDYFVQFEAPTGRTFSPQDQGGDDAVDSDPDTTTGITALINLNAGEDDDTVDAGLLPVVNGSISDFVFEDTDQDGSQDAGEPGIPGVTVNLWSNNNGAPGSVIATDTTDAGGLYLFDGLAPGEYFVEFVAPTGRTFTQANQGGDDTLDSDANLPNGVTSLITLGAGEDNDTVDAGLLPILDGSISDFVFEDTDSDGIQDAGEPGVPGVIVNLWSDNNGAPGSIIANDTTDANGLYAFMNLPAGSYFVQFVAPTGRTFTTQDVGDDSLDSDPDTATGITAAIPLGNGEDIDTVDAGLLPITGASISNFVFEDTDSDGIQDAGEPGVPGVTVNLWSNNNGAPGSVIGTDTTDGAGLYLFDNLSAGDYFVQFVAPTGRTFSPQDQGGDDAVDSDPDTTTGITALITLGADEDDDTVDAGLLPTQTPGSISDLVFEDTDQDGVQDAGEPGVPGVSVRLWSDNNGAPGVIIATDTTDADGLYLFDGLAAGNYFVQFVVPTGRTLTAQDQGGDDAADSDPDVGSGITDVIVLGNGENNPDVDAGLLPLDATIGDFVWVDVDLDGQQDAGEPGVAGVTVNVWATDAAGNIPDGTMPIEVMTDANGEWTVDVAPGFYRINVIVPTGATGFTSQNTGDDATDSDVAPAGDPSFGFTDVYTISSGQTNLTIDAGVIFPAELGNFVWLDADRDGIQDAGEAGVEGVTVQVADSGGGVVATTTTDVNGAYLVTGLTPGEPYTVTFINTVVNGATFTLQDQGGDDALDSDADATTGITAPVTLGAGESNQTIDAGIAPPLNGSISDFVFEDTDRDGVQDAGEPGVSNVTVNLLDGAGNQIATTTTDADGMYLFDQLGAGDYIVEFVAPTGRTFVTADQGGDDALDSDADPGTGRTPVISLGNDEQNDSVDAGLEPPPGASISDFVFEDTDQDGVQDAGEPGVSGVTVNLWSDVNGAPGAVIATTTTDASGLYLFDGLDAGTYFVQFVAPTGRTFTAADQGGDDALDSDADATTGITAVITLADDQDDNTVDAGLLPVPNPVIGLAKRVTQQPTLNLPVEGLPRHTIQFTFVIDNLGNVPLTDVILTDDFDATFPSPANVVSGPTPVGGTCGAEVAAAPGHSLAVGESCTAVWEVVVETMEFNRTYLNTATVTGTPPVGDPVTDISDDGAITDTDGDGNPDEPGENDPTPVRIPVDQCFGDDCPVTPEGCTTNDGNVVPQEFCPEVLEYPGPFNNMPSVPQGTFEAVDAAPGAPAPPLALTGSSAGVLATLAIALMGAGGALMIGTRRKSDEF